tara:strand:+ start:141 stop:251 length:111 start_codon:yes stop_codon:yes gene_type:complete
MEVILIGCLTFVAVDLARGYLGYRAYIAWENKRKKK